MNSLCLHPRELIVRRDAPLASGSAIGATAAFRSSAPIAFGAEIHGTSLRDASSVTPPIRARAEVGEDVVPAVGRWSRRFVIHAIYGASVPGTHGSPSRSKSVVVAATFAGSLTANQKNRSTFPRFMRSCIVPCDLCSAMSQLTMML